jgi:co-chaperonin GroES (HSP10)
MAKTTSETFVDKRRIGKAEAKTICSCGENYVMEDSEFCNLCANKLVKQAQEENYLIPLQAVGARMFVRNDDSMIRSGMIYIPDNAQRRSTIGVIINLGPDIQNQDLKLGIRIMFDQYAGRVVEIRGYKNITLVREDEVLAIVTKSLKEIEESSASNG